MRLAMVPEDRDREEIEAEGFAPVTPHVPEFGRIEALERRFAELAGELVHVGREWLFEWNSLAAARLSSGEVAEMIGAQLPHLAICIESNPEGWEGSFTMKDAAGIPHAGRKRQPRLPVFPTRTRAA